MNEELINLLTLQHDLALKLKALKDAEAKVRVQITDLLLADKPVGTHKFQFDNIMVKAVKKVTYSLDQEMVYDILDQLDENAAAAIRTKYELNLTSYKKLGECPLLDDCITTKDAMPTLDVEFI